MPGREEGFGIVYLEAMLCGVQAVASLLDGSKKTVLDEKLGVLVSPIDPSSVQKGIREALSRGEGVPENWSISWRIASRSECGTFSIKYYMIRRAEKLRG